MLICRSRLPSLLLLNLIIVLLVSTPTLAGEVGLRSFNLEENLYRAGFGLDDGPHLAIEGRIEPSDVPLLEASISRWESRYPDERLRVMLNSPGGDVVVAVKMGEILRQVFAWSVVDKGATCASACVFVFAGGAERDAFIGSRFGLHRPRFAPEYFSSLNRREAGEKYRRLTAYVRDHLDKMGVDRALFDDMWGIPSTSMRYVDRSYADRVNLLGIDVAFEEWNRARTIDKYGIEYQRKVDEYYRCLNDGRGWSYCKNNHPLP